MFRRKQPPPPPPQLGAQLDRTLVPARLARVVDDAVEAERRWREVTAVVQPGPLADRLAVLGAQVEVGVREVHAVAVRVGEAERVLAALDPDGATAAYKAAKRRAADGSAPPEMEALEARFASVQRTMNLVADAEERLRVLDAQLLAVVARGAELALSADLEAAAGVGVALDDVVGELGALRSALSGLR